MQLPVTLGKYELLEFLGGGMSHVYRARDTVIDRPVVVKILTEQSNNDPEARARFLQEARLAGNIQHENIVSVFDFGEFNGLPYIVMEYLKGEDLRHAIQRGHLQGLDHRLRISREIAAALEHVHSRNIVHRDIKPENIHLDLQGRVKLMDFGIAKTADLSLTKAGLAMGTPYYMSPEQVAGRPATMLVDIYAYGLVLYELFTGKRGITGETMESVFYQILNVPLDVTELEQAGVPPRVRDLILRCADKNPETRYQSFQAILDDLQSILKGAGEAKTQAIARPQAPLAGQPPVSQPAAPAPVPRRNWRPWIQLAILLAFVMGSAVWYMNRGPRQIPGMIYIPAGPFLAGSDNHRVELSAFYIDETEVPNDEYCAVMGCQVQSGTGDLPVVNVTVSQARDFCGRQGRRLPTSMEWERALRGINGALFPWGDELNATRTNTADNPSSPKALMPARSLSQNPPFHMIGNAWEMVDGSVTPSQQAVAQFQTLLTPPPTADEPWVIIRGGSYNETLSPGLSYDTGSIPARFKSLQIGFRCAANAPR